MTPGVVNQNLAHRSCGHGEKMSPVLPAWIGLVGQSQISLADQRRRLQRVIGTLPAHIAMGEASEFFVDERG